MSKFRGKILLHTWTEKKRKTIKLQEKSDKNQLFFQM